jgi:hypothetical protein
MKRTKWYNGFQKPVRIGEYERDYWLSEDVLLVKDIWDGYGWVEPVTGFVCRQQHLPWRGLTKEAK